MKPNFFAAAVAAAFVAAPALAVVPLVDSPITVTSADVGKSFTYNYNGIGGDPSAVLPGLKSAITFTLTGVAGNVWSFSAAIDNTLSDPGTGGRIVSWGFDGNPEIVGATPLVGPFGTAVINAGFPQIGGQTTIDFCLTANNNCQGGGGGGLAAGTTGNQTFNLLFTNNPTNSVIFNHFIVRYQSITGQGRVTSGIGLGTGGGGFDGEGGGVPEPATWAMLLSGFGMVGFAARRRRGLASVSA
ncbi:cistern family PEP-CTERM protein [Sandarakinorhabdus oryzae]|uniref:cistern family PEP-CTERM protein n=1 Tax=Sandarakinorhabdus oryzae TaxID=2675220 RepID=UPI0012E2F937|nr:cistern family PEP-CTERM protein [Sandarakinorhabdus oryzae]